ncbi:sigma-54-dependent Fis family transcriptional regulator [bacterium]|nr:sigma-54-dependent Fis family transcriptional regulator [bacterium]
MPRALIIEDEAPSLEALVELVAREGFETVAARGVAEARERLGEQPVELVLCDLVLPDGSGMDLLDEVAACGAAMVLMTGHASVDTAVEALRRGVTDYLTKPLDLGRLKAILSNVARTRELTEEIGELRTALRRLGRFGPLVGNSAPMGAVYDLLSKVAPTEATVCIIGESGTGKEVVAQAVHELSRRRRGPFVPVNCGAVAVNLIETTLFGHEKGSFTGAERQHRGVFEQAEGGTLFLDEITEMPIELQVKLLRVLETGSVVRVGGEESIRVNARVIAATNRVPEEAVATGKLREDLWYRLKVFPVVLPPLRDRGGDIGVLAEHFLGELNAANGTTKTWDAAALRRLQEHAWPGNVRELKNLVHRAYILADRELGLAHIADQLGGAPPRNGGPSRTGPESANEGSIAIAVGSTVASAERRLIEATLAHCAGNKQRTAEMLGISLKTLYNRLSAYRAEAGRGTE